MEIKKAVREAENGGRHRGASTISQQTAKNVFLLPSSSWVRKGFEAYFTVLIEALWSKERFMEVYLISFETGDGLYGGEAVAEQIFYITADQLTEENLKKFQQAQNELSGALKSLLAVSEAYPNIKGTENFRDLQTQLEGTENRISTARVDYTNAVNKYNNSVMKFPGNIIAGMFGFEKKPQFQADEAAQTAPKVEF